jgi:hypothetical protein
VKTDKVIEGSVDAKYTYGKNVEGEASIELTIGQGYQWWRTREQDIKITKTFKLNKEGSVSFKFDIPSNSTSYYNPPLQLNVTVTDKYTDEKISKVDTIPVFTSSFNVRPDRYSFVKNKTNKITVSCLNSA